MDAEAKIDLEDAVAAYRRENGKFHVEQSLNTTAKEGAVMGGYLGIIVGAMLAVPFTAGASTAIAASAIGATAVAGGTAGAMMGADDATDWKERYGVTDEFVRQVGGMVQPGDSAIFALLRAENPKKIISHFARYGGTVLRTTLSPSAEEKLQQTIRA